MANAAPSLIPTGIHGLDEILGGGVPAHKIVMLVGGPGCGKSVFSMEFIVRGVETFSENGVYCSFEESRDDILANGASFGWNLSDYLESKRVSVCSFDVQGDQNVEVGSFNLDALFLRIEMAINAVGARRLVLDGINNLLAGFSNEKIVRKEVIRLFRWFKEKNITVLVTGERGVDTWTKFGFEEYLCDGLINLSNSVEENFTTRHLRIIKCRGVAHGTDLYPFLISSKGIEIMPILAADFDYHVAGEEFVSTGVDDLDRMLEGKGYRKGSTVLVTGTSGTGKSSMAAAFANAACERGEKAIYFSFEESAEQVIRNMRSIGLELQPWIDQGLLKIHASRSTVAGLEGHLIALRNIVDAFAPQVVTIDPITAFRPVAPINQIKLMLIRLNDFLRSRLITTMMTSLSTGSGTDELSDVPMSSLADSWISVRIQDNYNEKNNIVEIHKSRGMAHVKQRKELAFTAQGIHLHDLYMGPEGLLAGASRVAQQIKDREQDKLLEEEVRKLDRLMEIKKKAGEQRIAALQNDVQTEMLDLQGQISALRKRLKYREMKSEKVDAALSAEEVQDPG